MSRASAIRNAHFLGTKIRNLRKRNNLTMEDLSARCVKVDTESAPSVSYLSMIERGKRHPSEKMLRVIADVFQKDIAWFLDNIPDESSTMPDKGNLGGMRGMSLEPSFLFSKDILQNAIPEMLSQTGVSGRQFAHLLIRAHQENNQNHFPDLERAAESIGHKQMPISLAALMDICSHMGLTLRYFDKAPEHTRGSIKRSDQSVVRSFFEAPGTIYVNNLMKSQPERLKYDLALYIAHKVLHDGDGVKSVAVTGPAPVMNPDDRGSLDWEHSSAIDSQDIVHAWRDFECSFFAGALLLPKVPFRRLIEQRSHDVTIGNMLEVTTSVVMRRMTVVSSYPHWHYFDAYPPGRLLAVYRGNGIPLPWGNMSMVQDPCKHWAVFRMIDKAAEETSSQVSVMDVESEPRIFCCESVRVNDMSGSNHVLCAGIDVNPALNAQGRDAVAIATQLKEACSVNGGSAEMPMAIREELRQIAKLLNIEWLNRGIENPVRMICPRSGACPRTPSCHRGLSQ